ncbi:MAG TPA: protein kinase [Polyangiaceae bacterium]|nr:protein kinase [Polyangiaceae bacterium]
MDATQEDTRGAPVPAVPPGSTIQHYEIIRPLGCGGMGAVFLARDTRLGRLVAIKLIRGDSGGPVTRFLLEALATAQMTHENIVVIHELGEHLGTPYMVLEYLKGKTLDDLLRERQRNTHEDPTQSAETTAAAFSKDRAIELIIPVVRALVCAHERGVVHRDLKPSNIMVTDAGTVKVLDFGIAKWMNQPPTASDSAPAESRSQQAPALALTGTGMLVGTAPYMSPEQWGADAIDHRTDIWAVGVVLAELLLGRHPLVPLTMNTLATIGHLHVPMPSLREMRPELGKLGSIVDRCLLKRRDDRLGSASELLAELEALLPARGRLSADEKQNPFAGLSAFQETDAARFFGRTRAVMEVVTRLASQPLIAIVGPSGAGKSSFVRAGVIPAMGRTGEAYQALTIRPGRRPLTALAELLIVSPMDTQPTRATLEAEGREALVTALREAPGSLGAELRVRARRTQRRLLLFIDQFEEIYTLASDEERAAFFACIAGVADDAGSPLRVVLALRSDFLDRVTETEAAQIGLDRGIMPLSPMNRDGLRDALVRPLEAVDYRFEHPGMVEEMLTTLEHTASALPLLSFTAARLWEERDRARRVLTEASYLRIGGVAGTLARHAEATLTAMSPEERKLARTALLRLVTPERTRALCSRVELCALGASPAAMERVLGRLIDARLLTVEHCGEADAMVELVHESLIGSFPTLSRWVTENQEDAAFLTRLRHAAREWQASDRSEDLLWRGQAAEASTSWRAHYTGHLAPAEEHYLEAVRELAERRRRLRRRAIMGLIAALSVIAAAGVYLALRAQQAAALARSETARAEQQAARADNQASLEQAKAVQARNASRIAAAREWQADPTTMLCVKQALTWRMLCNPDIAETK